MISDPIRVLLIEDDEDDYLLTRDLLAEIAGNRFSLEWVRTYDAGLEAMRKSAHDVYLVDYRLDAHTGVELFREAMKQGCTGPIILLTGQGEREVDMEAMKAGFADFLVKGRIDAALLDRSVRYALERNRDRQALRALHRDLERRVEERTASLREEVAERKRAEEALQIAARRKDEFLAMLAHELRNPMAAARNGLHVLKSPRADEETLAKARAMMERQLGHLSRIVDDLLDVSRITRGKIVLRSERLDLGRSVRFAADDNRAAFDAAGVSLTVDVPDTPMWIAGDSMRLTQVLDNILGNALKFTDAGGRVSVRLESDPEHRRAVLTVRDSGIGIEPDMLEQVFEAFAQADRSLDRSRGGLGLGLALVKGLIQLHGGEVHVESAGKGKGTQVTVLIPAAPEPEALTGMPESRPQRSNRRRILVVEDNRDAADSLRLLLEMYGYRVDVAYTGPDGVKAAGECRPDIVLCDIGLPGLDGYGVAAELRSNPATAKIRLIAVTGYGQEEDRRRSRAAGFDHHLVKPVNPDMLQPLLAGA